MTQREQQILQLIGANPLISQQELADRLGITRSSVAVHISNLQKKGFIAGKGYVLKSGDYAVVVGGVNMDIGGRSFAALVNEDSNPGAVSTSMGGVGRNIAHNLTLLGADVKMLTAVGEDAHGRQILSSCSELGIDLTNALRCSDCNTSTYLYIARPDGEMALAISDMQICERITPAYLESHLGLLQNARLVVVDANIPEESLAFLAENCTAPLFCDPVSTVKAVKLKPILNKIHTLKPNRLEAELLTGIPVTDGASAEKCAKKLLEAGVKRVFLSMGAQGVYATDGEESFWQPILPAQMVSTTGCGDASMAAVCWSFLEGHSLKETALAAVAAGAVAMESNQTINPAMSAEAIQHKMYKGE